MSPPGKNAGVTTKLSVESAMRPVGASEATPASLPAWSSGASNASRKISSIMRFIICPPDPWPSRTVSGMDGMRAS